MYLPWQQNAVFVEELGGFGAFFRSQNVRFTHPHYTGQSVLRGEGGGKEGGGGVGARQSITPDTHKAHFMGIKEAATMSACVCAYMCCHGCTVRLVQACASMCQKGRACVCVCLLSLLSVLRALCGILCVRLCA